MNRHHAALVVLSATLLSPVVLSAEATLYVDDQIVPLSCTTYDPTTRSCDGGTERAYKTIAGANSAIAAGETALIRGGTYVDRIAPAQSGTATAPITYRRYGAEEVVLTGKPSISLTNLSYITVDGVTVRVSGCAGICYLLLDNSHHISIENTTMDESTNQTSWPTGLRIRNSSHHNRFINNTIGKVGYSGVNPIDDIGGVAVIGTGGSGTDRSDYNLFEGNHFFSGGHHIIELYGSYNVFRDNLFHNEEWNACQRTETGNRCGNRNIILDGHPSAVRYNLFDGNRISFSGVPADSTTVSSLGLRTPHNIIRRNLFYSNDGPGIAVETYTYYPHNVDRNHIYNNVFYRNGFNKIAAAPADYRYGLLVASRGGAAINGLAIKNNIFYDNNAGAMIFGFAAARSAQTVENNWEAADPLFVNPLIGPPGSTTEPDLQLRLGSSGAVDAGGFLTTTASAGSGTTIPVADANYFTDGFGLIEGDVVQMQGQTTRALIVGIDYATNTITVDTPLTWDQGVGIGLAYEGPAPDVGAYEFPPDTAAPTVPTDLAAAAIVSSRIDLSWSGSTDDRRVAGYQIYRDGVEIATSASTYYSDVGLNAETLYTYTVSAYDAAGNISEPSAGASATTPPPDTIPPVVSGVTNVDTLSNRTSIIWTTDEPSDSQVVFVNQPCPVVKGCASDVLSELVTSHRVDLDGLALSTTYTYEVRSRDASGNLAVSSPQTFVTTGDVAPPAISVLTPVGGARVVSTITVSADASDDVGVAAVQFKLDNQNLGAEVTARPYAISWDTKQTLNGSHTLSAVARDAAGNTSAAAAVTVTVDNDYTPPTLSLIAPANNATVSGTATAVSAIASDNVNVIGVQFMLDGLNFGPEDTSPPYSISWNTTTVGNGPHTLAAVTRDAAGNIAASTIAVNVANPITHVPQKYTVRMGAYSSGNIGGLSADDNNYLVVRSTTSGTKRSITEFEFASIAPASRVDYTVRLKANASSTSVIVFAYHYPTAAWIQLKSFSVGTTETTQTGSITTAAASYISGGKMLLRVQSTRSSSHYIYNEVMKIVAIP